MDYKELSQRYLDATESLADKKQLSEILDNTESLTFEQRALQAIQRYNRRQTHVGTTINTHTSTTLRWQLAAAAVACCAIIIGATIHLSRPTVYCYYNGRPITSLAEAEGHAQRVINELCVAELTTDEDMLYNMFRME